MYIHGIRDPHVGLFHGNGNNNAIKLSYWNTSTFSPALKYFNKPECKNLCVEFVRYTTYILLHIATIHTGSYCEVFWNTFWPLACFIYHTMWLLIIILWIWMSRQTCTRCSTDVGRLKFTQFYNKRETISDVQSYPRYGLKL